MKRFILNLVLLVSFTLELSSQVIKLLDDVHFHKVMISDKVITAKYVDISGSPYWNDNFIKSKLYFRNDSVYSINLRYNIYDHQMEYKYKGVIYAISNPESIYKIEMGKSTFIYFMNRTNYKLDDYYELLVDGKAILLNKHEVVFRDAEKPKGIYEPKAANFQRKPDRFYILLNGNELKELKNKKSIFLIFGKESNMMQNYAKTEKISLRKKDDLIRFINYFNSNAQK